MDGLIPNYNNFKDTPYDAFYGDISNSAEFKATLPPGFRVKMISNTAFTFALSNSDSDTIDYSTAGDTTFVPANTYFEFEVHVYRKYFYCKATTNASNLFVNLTYINGFIGTP
jgi:hypothetical protein